MATYQDLIDLAMQQALAGGDQLQSALLDADMTMESLVQTVFQTVARRLADDEEGRSLLRRTHSITLTNGVGVVPDEVLTQCKYGASIADSADDTVAQLQSLVPYWQDFVQPRSGLMAQIPWWTIKDDVALHYLEIGEDYDPTTGFNGPIELTIASVPVVPAANTDPLDVVAEVFSDLVTALATAIKGLLQQKVAA
jgi:hypothetical protein